MSYFAAGLFWAAGTLHLLVTTNNPSSVYRYRLIHYKLNLANGWNFEYQSDSSQALRSYIVSGTDINFAQVFKTNTGISQFFRARNTVEFGDTANYNSGKNNSLLRFEITDNGNFLAAFIDDSQIEDNTNVPYMVHGDRAWFRGGRPYGERGTFEGITYFSNDGFPIASTDIENREYEYNIWTNNVAEPDRSEIIYHGASEIKKYFPSNSNNPYFYLNTGGDGSYLIKALARYVCETGEYGCSSSDRVDLVYFFLKESYDASPVLIDAQKRVSGSNKGDSYYIQISNSQKSACDRFGNQLVPFGYTLAYYKARSGYGINIASQMGFQVNNIRNKPATTPYGFAVIAHSGNLFTSSSLNLAFVQTQQRS